MTYILITAALIDVQKVFTTGYLYRRLRGGEWQKIWYNRWNQGGYEVWECRRPNFDWESVGGRVVAEETK
jgi:hypothetical protein